VPARHLVARLHAALDGEIHLHHLLHTRGSCRLRELLALDLEQLVEILAQLVEEILERLELRLASSSVRLTSNTVAVDVVEIRLGDLRAPRELPLGPRRVLPVSTRSIRPNVSASTIRSWSRVLLVPLELVIDDLLGALVALDAFAREHLHVDHATRHARGHAQRRVLHVEAFSPKIAAQQFFLRVSWVSAFGVTLPTSTSPAATSAPMYRCPTRRAARAAAPRGWRCRA